MKIYIAFFFLITSCLLCNICSAQSQIDTGARAMMPDRLERWKKDFDLLGKIIICNANGQQIIYTNSDMNQKIWSRQALPSGFSHTYKLAKLIIKIVSKKGEVIYELTSGSEYKIKWNTNKEIWDVYLTRELNMFK